MFWDFCHCKTILWIVQNAIIYVNSCLTEFFSSGRVPTQTKISGENKKFQTSQKIEFNEQKPNERSVAQHFCSGLLTQWIWSFVTKLEQKDWVKVWYPLGPAKLIHFLPCPPLGFWRIFWKKYNFIKYSIKNQIWV